jgi:hypothetical protein
MDFSQNFDCAGDILTSRIGGRLRLARRHGGGASWRRERPRIQGMGERVLMIINSGNKIKQIGSSLFGVRLRLIQPQGIDKMKADKHIVRAEFDRIRKGYFPDWKDFSEWRFGIKKFEDRNTRGVVLMNEKEIWINKSILPDISMGLLGAVIVHEICHAVAHDDEQNHGAGWCEKMEKVALQAQETEREMADEVYSMFKEWSWNLALLEASKEK